MLTAITLEIRNLYASNTCLVVHWDGKLLPDVGKQKVDHLPFIVTDPQGTAKIPKLAAGTGQAVVKCLEDWQLSDHTVGMSFDTTSSNTGSALGACALLQQMGCTLFHLACRHYILELMAEAAFTASSDLSSGPDIAMFKHFQSSWNFIDKSKYEPTMRDDLNS